MVPIPTSTSLDQMKKSFLCTKAILAARSQVFAAMFEHNMQENLQKKVEIEDFSDEIIGQMIQFMYSGKVQKLRENAKELLAIADKYDVKGLKVMAEQFLGKNISVENVIETLILADKCNAQKLKERAMGVIQGNMKALGRSGALLQLGKHNEELFTLLF